MYVFCHKGDGLNVICYRRIIAIILKDSFMAGTQHSFENLWLSYGILYEYEVIRDSQQPKHLEKEENGGGYAVLSFQIYCRATAFKQFGM